MRKFFAAGVPVLVLLTLTTGCGGGSSSGNPGSPSNPSSRTTTTGSSNCPYTAPNLPPLPGTTVVMGDSYASGEGTYNNGSDCSVPPVDYYPETATGDDQCHRSPAAYAPLLGVTTSNFVACSGSAVDGLLNARDTEGPQVDILTKVHPTTVILSIGGNNAGLQDVLTNCIDIAPLIHGSSGADCTAALERTKSTIDNTLPGKLDGLYRKIELMSNDARLVVVGYPLVFPAGGNQGCNFINADRQIQLNRSVDYLDQAIQRAVAKIPGAMFVDVRDTFVGHEICGDTSGAYINDLQQNRVKLGEANCPDSYVVADVCSQSFHPNVNGWAAEANLISGRVLSQPSNPSPPARPTTDVLTFQPWVAGPGAAGLAVPIPGVNISGVTGSCDSGSADDPGRATAFRCHSAGGQVGNGVPCFANTISGDPGSPLLCSSDPTNHRLVRLTQVAGAQLPLQRANGSDPAAPAWFLILANGYHCRFAGYGTNSTAFPYECGHGVAASLPDRTTPTWTVSQLPVSGRGLPGPRLKVLTAIS